ncbi:MAG TPA: hypothetical protein VF487_15920 [Chitinophagaceae bacterium]
MKIIFFGLVVSCVFLLTACQKEAGFSNGSGSGTGSGDLLTKLVSKSGSDSSSISFGYNAAKKLTTLDFFTLSNGQSAEINERAERNSQGIIQRVIIKSDVYQQAGVDSAITVVGYNGGKYTSKVTSFDLVVIVLKDSVALAYDAAGKVSSERSFTDVGGAYEEYQKVEYTYSGNNLASIKYYSYDASTPGYTLVETFTYDQYDSKASPIYFGYEAFVLGSPFFFSSNNPLKSTITATGSTAQNYTTTYTYNAANKPLTATSIIQPGNAITTGTYYYQ